MRFLIITFMILLAVGVCGYLLLRKSIGEYLKYHKIGLSCYDRDTGTFNEALDAAVLASDEVNAVEAMGYATGRETAKMRHLKAQERYHNFKGASK